MISFDEHTEIRPGAHVALGMSGGVDSSVAARLLMDAGFRVVGVTCVFTDDANARQAADDARAVAEQLGIRHIVKDCTRKFACTVVDPFVEEYAAGLTPSPCVMCNRACKIPALIEAADACGCEFVATGHYARIVCRGDRVAVSRAAHAAKDQSYMLATLSQDQLRRLLLPLGSVEGGKARVRELAAEWGMPVASKSDSQDICFIHGSHLDFLDKRGVHAAPGDIVDRNGRVVGRHEGLFRYTVGQRKGLNIGGAPEPYYVVEKRRDTNELVVAFASETLIEGVRVASMVWQAASPSRIARLYAERGPLSCTVKLRYRQVASPCRCTPVEADGDMSVSFVDSSAPQYRVKGSIESVCAVDVALDEPQATTAPGQFAVFYDGDVVLGAGVIERVTRAGA